jgi:carotenoid cleavage dioxygenase
VLPATSTLAPLQFGDQEGLRGMFVAMLELLKQRVGILKGVPVAQQGMGTANTSLVYHAGRLLALHEGDLPYQVRRCCCCNHAIC